MVCPIAQGDHNKSVTWWGSRQYHLGICIIIHACNMLKYGKMRAVKTLLQQNPPVLNWGCWLTQVVLYNGYKMVVVGSKYWCHVAEWCQCSLLWLLQSRLEALNQLQELLLAPRHSCDKLTPSSSSDVSMATTLLSSAHHQLLVGCFGFGLLDGVNSSNGSQLCHYQVSVDAHNSWPVSSVFKA